MLLTFLWDRECQYCQTMLLTGELPEFCCNRGKHMIPSLPSYPENINNILIDPTCSNLSRKLNALFSFTAIGVQGQFVTLPAPSSVCITGHTYYRILLINTPNHSLHWYIYNEQERYTAARDRKIPNEWISAVQSMLDQNNPYINSLKIF